jgi:hypothetical protein
VPAIQSSREQALGSIKAARQKISQGLEPRVRSVLMGAEHSAFDRYRGALVEALDRLEPQAGAVETLPELTEIQGKITEVAKSLHALCETDLRPAIAEEQQLQRDDAQKKQDAAAWKVELRDFRSGPLVKAKRAVAEANGDKKQLKILKKWVTKAETLGNTQLAAGRAKLQLAGKLADDLRQNPMGTKAIRKNHLLQSGKRWGDAVLYFNNAVQQLAAKLDEEAFSDGNLESVRTAARTGAERVRSAGGLFDSEVFDRTLTVLVTDGQSQQNRGKVREQGLQQIRSLRRTLTRHPVVVSLVQHPFADTAIPVGSLANALDDLELNLRRGR